MSTIILAALGAIIIVVVLLFRRIKTLARRAAESEETIRQLTETDVELYRELIRLRRRMNGEPAAGRASPEPAGGDGPALPSSSTWQPARRERHLRLCTDQDGAPVSPAARSWPSAPAGSTEGVRRLGSTRTNDGSK